MSTEQTYQLTPETVEFLKNFARINNQAIFSAGQLQRACNPTRNFIADIAFPVAFPRDFALYELTKLLGVIDLTKGSLPSITFQETSLIVTHDHASVTLPYAAENVIAKPPTAQFHAAKTIATFDLPVATWNLMEKTASVLGTTTLQFITTDTGTLTLRLVTEKGAADMASTSTGSAEIIPENVVVHEPTNAVWAVKFQALELLAGDYTVEAAEVNHPNGGAAIFGVFFRLKDATKQVTYLTSGHVVKGR